MWVESGRPGPEVESWQQAPFCNLEIIVAAPLHFFRLWIQYVPFADMVTV